MFTQSRRLLQALPVLVFALLFSACSDLVGDDTSTSATSEDAEVMAQVVADALSDQEEGVMADVYDLTGDIEAEGILYMDQERPPFRGRPPFRMDDPNRPWRSAQIDYNAVYDSLTGTHTITYSREVERRNMTKNVDVLLQYIFTDDAGNFIAQPKADRDLVAQIDFTGERTGASSAVRGREGQVETASTFAQDAAWTLTGANTNTLSLVGSKTKSGTFDMTSPDSTKARTFTLTVTTDDVTIVRPDEPGDLETSITGTLNYELRIERTVNGETEITEESGTIELTGEGRARIRFLGLNRAFWADLRTGEVDEQ